MNRRDLLKAIIASPFAAAAGSSVLKATEAAPVPAPIKPLGDFTVFESLYRPPECTYRTTRAHAPAIGSEVSVERNGEVYFVGVVDSTSTSSDGMIEVTAKGHPLDLPDDYLREIYEDHYGLPHSIQAVNYPAAPFSRR